MAALLQLTEGWTELLGPFILKNDGVALNLTGFTVSLSLRGTNGVLVPILASQITVDPLQSTTGAGKVYYRPVAGNIKAVYSPYTIRWKVVDSAGDVIYVPNGVPNIIEVYNP